MSIVAEELLDGDILSDNEILSDFGEETSELDASDDLEESIDPSFDLPDKFKDKSVGDIAKSYIELEKEMGRKNNEVGELRKITDDYIKQQLEPTQEPKESPKIDLDDLLEDPDSVIRKALDNSPRVAALEEELRSARVEEKRKVFESKHNEWETTLNSTDFQDWIKGSTVRSNMFASASQAYDYDVADELFTLYGELRGASKEVAEKRAKTNRNKALKTGTLEKGSTGEMPKKIYKRTDIIRLMQTDPSRYADMESDIRLAYAEGRVR